MLKLGNHGKAEVVWVTAGGPFVISMLVGASTCMFCANLGTNMNFEGKGFHEACPLNWSQFLPHMVRWAKAYTCRRPSLVRFCRCTAQKSENPLRPWITTFQDPYNQGCELEQLVGLQRTAWHRCLLMAAVYFFRWTCCFVALLLGNKSCRWEWC